MKRSIVLLLPCALALAFSGPALGHTGLEFFLQEVPDPDAMTMDGDDSDWGWFDNDLALDRSPILGRGSSIATAACISTICG
jgi:hypothetical protein